MSQSSFRTYASLAESLLVLVASFGLWILSYIEHMKNIRPSSIINAYLFVSLLFDVAQLRTKWLRGRDFPANAVASATLAVKFLILVSEAIEKRGLLSPPYAESSPEATSGLYSQGVFWWLNPLFRLGFKNNIRNDDLFTADRDLKSEFLQIRFRRHWGDSMYSYSLVVNTYSSYRAQIPPKT
jgi:ATP-binding cassette subfamily C (CFTR/MRP) protein 1